MSVLAAVIPIPMSKNRRKPHIAIALNRPHITDCVNVPGLAQK